jgi:hypothetical protein
VSDPTAPALLYDVSNIVEYEATLDPSAKELNRPTQPTRRLRRDPAVAEPAADRARAGRHHAHSLSRGPCTHEALFVRYVDVLDTDVELIDAVETRLTGGRGNPIK